MQKVNINKLPQGEIEIEGELEANVFETYFSKALKKINDNTELDGFRKGKVPENVLLSRVPEIRVLEEMAEMALAEHYPKILEQENLDVISRPEISITKLARKNPLGFKIKTAIMPEIKLPLYKEIAKTVISQITDKEKDITVTDEDVENTILDIRKSRAPKKHITEMAEPHIHKEGEEHKHEEETKEELPVFNDEFVQALGPFKNVEDFKEKLRVNIKLEKENQIREKTRLKIVEKIIDESVIDLPNVLVEIELDKILYRMESDITQMGMKFEDYLKHLYKTVEEIRKEFRKDAEKKAKLGLVLNEISKLENIVANEDEVKKEVDHILEHYKDADPTRAAI